MLPVPLARHHRRAERGLAIPESRYPLVSGTPNATTLKQSYTAFSIVRVPERSGFSVGPMTICSRLSGLKRGSRSSRSSCGLAASTATDLLTAVEARLARRETSAPLTGAKLLASSGLASSGLV